jgi:hypothetical protein
VYNFKDVKIVSDYYFLKYMQEINQENKNSDLIAIREKVLTSLDVELQGEIKRLENNVPNSAVTLFIDKTLKLGRAEKLKSLDRVLNSFGESIGSLSVIDNFDDQVLAVASIEKILNTYFNEEDRSNALNNLKDLIC